MTSLMGGLLVAYLLSASFVDQVQLNVSSLQKLVDYSYSLNFTQLIPGELYNGSIRADWAVPRQAIAGLGAQSITVKITASTGQNSTISFPSSSGTLASEYEAYLRCDVENGSCANTSVLSIVIPVIASTMPDSAQLAQISLKSEIVQSSGAPTVTVSASGLLDSLRDALGHNNSSASAPGTAQPSNGSLLPNGTNLSGAADFLDSLQPEGNYKDPVSFLRDNPVVSLTALAIVIVVTGAYLLKVKD